MSEPMITPPMLLTVQQVAKYLQCSLRSVASWAASGELPSVKLGRLRRYRSEDVMDFVAGHLASTGGADDDHDR